MKTQVHLKGLTKSEMMEEFHKPTNPLRDAFVPEGERVLAQAVKNAVITLTGVCRHDEKVDAVIEIDTTESLSVKIDFKKIVPVAAEEPKKDAPPADPPPADPPPAEPPAEVGPEKVPESEKKEEAEQAETEIKAPEPDAEEPKKDETDVPAES